MTTPTPPQPADRFNPRAAAARIHDLNQQISAIKATRPAELATPYAFLDDPTQQQAWRAAYQQWTTSHPTAEHDLAAAHQQVHAIAGQAETAGWDPQELWDSTAEPGAPLHAPAPADGPAPAEPIHQHTAIDTAAFPETALDPADGFGLDA